MRRFSLLLLCLLCCQNFCVMAEGEMTSVVLKNVPHITQKPDFCGEACVAMYLQSLGHKVTQDQVFNVSGLDPQRGRGCYSSELLKALRNLGFKPGSDREIFSVVKPASANAGLLKLFKKIHANLKKNIPAIVCMHYCDSPETTEHFRLIVGYDAAKKEVIYHEPAVTNGEYRRMKLAKFLNLWPLKYYKDHWIAVNFTLNPAKLKIPAAVKTQYRTIIDEDWSEKVVPVKKFARADYAQHILNLKSKYGSKGLTYLIEPPFVVVGNENPHIVRRRASRTVRWTIEKLKKGYFDYNPDRILTVWLLKDKPTYSYYCEKITGSEPGTPFGFYSSHYDALVMNIATGGGTLVHEIVHPFVESNFPACPSWLNEGLGSLYEQAGERDGKIIGLTNWRLPGLQKLIKADNLPSFKELTSYSTNEFYNMDRGGNYGQSRYLCYYLQEKGLLRKFYKEFYRNQKSDRSGYKTLKKILDVDDMDKFKKEWQKYVLKLRFR